MKRDQFLKILNLAVNEYCPNVDLKWDTKFYEIEIDSLDLMRIIIKLEESLNLKIDVSKLSSNLTAQDLYLFVKEKIT